MNIIFATHNDHKTKEVSNILANTNWTISSLKDIGYKDEIIENGATLNENAWIKADQIYRITGKNVMADDTGLEVQILNNEPGVYSARYAGVQRNDIDNMNKLLKALDNTEDRSARFRTVVACYVNGKKYTCEGIVKGHIATEMMGTKGFGYDPIFIPEGYQNSFGILDESIKNKISHRAAAFRKCRDLFLTL